MDPDAALQDLMDALTGEDWDAANEAAENLSDWLDGGGFPPKNVTRITWQHLMDGIIRVLQEAPE